MIIAAHVLRASGTRRLVLALALTGLAGVAQAQPVAPGSAAASAPTSEAPAAVASAPASEPAAAPASAPASAPADGTAANADLSTAAIIEGIQAFYAEAQDLKADFEQRYTYKVYGRVQVSSGKVFFKKKNKMRWDYRSPEQKVFVADGRVLWVYEPEQAQVFRRELGSSQLPVALTFMSGEGRLAEEFNAKRLPDPVGGQTLVVELVPKRNAGDYQSLRLEVDRATFAVRSSTVLDPVGNTNHVIFRDVKTNSGLPDGGFSFQVPEGVKVVGEPNR